MISIVGSSCARFVRFTLLSSQRDDVPYRPHLRPARRWETVHPRSMLVEVGKLGEAALAVWALKGAFALLYMPRIDMACKAIFWTCRLVTTIGAGVYHLPTHAVRSVIVGAGASHSFRYYPPGSYKVTSILPQPIAKKNRPLVYNVAYCRGDRITAPSSHSGLT